MDQRNNSRQRSSLLASATEDEITVSQILVDLKNLMSLSESLSNFNWRCKKRRSCYVRAPPLPRAPSSPSPSIQRTTENKMEKGRTTFSPDTPLSFSPSESDEKSKHSSKKSSSKKRSREEYLDMIEGLTQRKELLRGEVETVKRYYDKLKAYNSELKAMKQEAISTCTRKEEEPQMEISLGMNVGIELTQQYRVDTVPHHQPLIGDPTAQTSQCPSGPITAHLHPSTNGPDSVNHVGRLGFDLNFPAEEEVFGVDSSEPLDVGRVIEDKRARFAEARRRRRALIKVKSMRKGLGSKNCQRTDNSNETLVL